MSESSSLSYDTVENAALGELTESGGGASTIDDQDLYPRGARAFGAKNLASIDVTSRKNH